MIDKTLCDALPDWKKQFVNHRAILLSLEGTRNEEDLLDEFIEQLKDQGILPESRQSFEHNERPVHDSLSHLFNKLQRTFSENGHTLVILMDEMEILGEYEKDGGAPIAELLGKVGRDYVNLLFIHTGSYKWRERVSTPGSHFTHLKPHYLKSIDQDDMVSFLLEPLVTDDMRSQVAKLSGGKPLYAQHIGEILDDGKRSLSQDELLEYSDALRGQIEQNIYEERSLNDISKKILLALAYHPASTEGWLAKKLKARIRRNLVTLVEFGTISESGRKYRITGKLIETHGKKSYDDPCPPKPLREKLLIIARWVLMFAMFALAIKVYFYVHPESRQEACESSDMKVTVDFPCSVETGEEGKLEVIAHNKSDISVNALKLVFTCVDDKIVYRNKKKQNHLLFADIDPGGTMSGTIDYKIMSGNNDKLSSEVNINDSKNDPLPFSMDRRRLPIKKRYHQIWEVFLVILGALAPWKQWNQVTAVSRKLFSVDQPGNG